MRDFLRRHPEAKIVALIGLIALAALVGAVLWDLSRECVQWQTRIEVTKSRNVEVRVCTETRPRWGEWVGK